MSLNGVKIPSPIMELAPFDNLKNWWISCDSSSALTFDWIFFFLSGNKDNHKHLDEFEL